MVFVLRKDEYHVIYNRILYYKEWWSFNLEIFGETEKEIKNDKNARIQYRQISLYIELLQRNGVNLNGNIIKHLEDGIWELRPGVNRIFFFYFENGTYVLLHQYRKKTQKTPKREIKKAKQERKEYLQKKEKENENMEWI